MIILSLIPAEAAKPASGGRASRVLVAANSVFVAAAVVAAVDNDDDVVVLEMFDVALGLCVGVDCVLVWDKSKEVVFTDASVNLIPFKLNTNITKSITLVTTTIRLVTNLLPSEQKIIWKQLVS